MCTTPKSTKRKSLNAKPDEGLSDVSKLHEASKHFDALDQDEEQFRLLAEAQKSKGKTEVAATKISDNTDDGINRSSWFLRLWQSWTSSH